MACDNLLLLKPGYFNLIMWFLWKSESHTSQNFPCALFLFLHLFLIFFYYRLSLTEDQPEV